ncbi:MAG: CHASE2 domain-containing protein [Pseudanabaenaceae cyanobacterium bins.68]|nr:CHASE2 domain-containing protein [Pseudanabaenaceae cyanobacterium bins.68]
MKIDITGTWQQLRRFYPKSSVAGAGAIALVILVRLTGSLQVFEWYLFDRMMRYRPPEPVDQRLVIVGVTERDIPKAGFPISDAELAKLIKRLNSFQPRAIGLDIFRDLPVAAGRRQLGQLFRTTKNLIVIEKSVLPDEQNTFIQAPQELPANQVGFADILLDADGNIRRSLLAGGGRLSLAARLAALYLGKDGWQLENGKQDQAAFQFVNAQVSKELRRFQANDGGYVRSDSFGNQILVNWRNSDRLPIISLYDQRFNPNLKPLYDPNFDPQLIRDRVVLIGYIAPFSAKDMVNVPAISDQPIYGVEFHAHSVSEILSTVLDRRSSLSFLPEALEYLGIAIAGLAGTTLALRQTSARRTFGSLAIACGGLGLFSYGALVLSWWLPLVPMLLSCAIAGLVTRYFQDLESLIITTQELSAQRQQTLDEAFNALHNGPLHSLAELIGKARTQRLELSLLGTQLESLDRELRQVYESLRPDSMQQEELPPLDGLVSEVIHRALQREFIGYQNLKYIIRDIHPVDDSQLSPKHKRELCSFLDEALCNVGKHAEGCTKLQIVCKQEGKMAYLRVVDNGKGLPASTPIKPRGGTSHAMQLAKQLGGEFRRLPNQPKGTICEISWSIGRR